MKRNEGVTTFKGNPLTLLGDMVKKGDKAKDFSVVANDLSEVKLSDYDGKIRILSLAPSVDTPVCADQTRRFNLEAAKMQDAVVMAISMDLPFALGRFCAAEGIDAVKTLSDHRAADFGLKYGFLVDGLRILNRGIVVVDKDGTIQHVEYVKENVEHPDYDNALKVAKSLA
jgi:thioredoxin-dependent peroxiredoxin